MVDLSEGLQTERWNFLRKYNHIDNVRAMRRMSIGFKKLQA